MMGRLAYSIDRFCEETDTGKSKVYELIRTGKLRAKKFGSKTLILAEDAENFLASLPDMPGEAPLGEEGSLSDIGGAPV